MATVKQVLEYADSQTDLTVVAFTDHDDIAGGLAAREEWARGSYRVQVVPGAEITTLEGHLLALFIDEPVPLFRPVEETLEAVHRQGGLCVIPHPMNWLTRSLGRRTIERVMRHRGSGVYFDGMQTANRSPGSRVALKTARRLNTDIFRLPELGGSDAHFAPALGSSYTEFPGETAEELRQALLEGTTRGVEGAFPSLAKIGYRTFLLQQWRGLAVTPKKAGLGPTIVSFFKRFKPTSTST